MKRGGYSYKKRTTRNSRSSRGKSRKKPRPHST